MKKLILILSTTISANICAQEHFVGVTGGISWTNINSENFVSGNDSRTGFSGGLSYSVLLKKKFTLGSDIVYSQRGFSSPIIFRDINGNTIGGKTEIKFNYNYLSIPVKAGVTFGKTIYGFGHIGAIPSLLIDAKTISPVVDGNGNTIGTETTNTTSRVSKFDFAGLVEIGGGYVLNKYLLFTSITYQQSVTTITNSAYFADSNIRHRGLTMSFGVKYRLTKE